MPDRFLWPAAWAGIAGVLATLLTIVLLPERIRVGQREWMFDAALAISPRSPPVDASRVIFVDIDRASLNAHGPWPWRRGLVAETIEAALKNGASAVAVDILFSGSDQRSPGSVARRLAAETGDPAIRDAAERLEDGDRRLAAAMQGRPVALSMLLDPAGSRPPEGAPVLTRGYPALTEIWSTIGVQGPHADLAGSASGLGVSSLPADADGIVRRVPALVRAGDGLAPGLAVEAARLASEASGYLLSGPGALLMIGDMEIALPPDGMLRLSPVVAGPPVETVPAHVLLSGHEKSDSIKGAVAFIGSSAPEAGGLRLSNVHPLVSSTLLHAMAFRQLQIGLAPRRVPLAFIVETGLALLAGLVALMLALRLRPAAAGVGIVLIAVCLLATTASLAGKGQLLDPGPALAAAAAGFVMTSIVGYALTRKREAALRRRFEQHLAPDVVARIAAAPDSLKLSGERRRITALFTDIEGFSQLTGRAGPEELIALLDGYFEGLAGIVVAHGGMIDKFVGDAAHVFFNAPLDIPAHTDKAITCAVAIIRWTESYRMQGSAGRLAMGRTRIGIEEGEVVVGDVGLATKLDYTAHGTAVNLAARLEALNKELGTEICIGPAAARATSVPLHSLGQFDVRGAGHVEVFTPAGVRSGA